MLAWTGIQNRAAADGLHGRIVPYHEAVSLFERNRLLQPQLRIAALSGTQSIAIQQNHFAQHFVRSRMQMDSAVVFDRTR